MGAYLVMFPGAMVRTLVFVVFFVTVIHLPAIILIGLWFLLQLYQGITSVGTTRAPPSGRTSAAWLSAHSSRC